MRKKLQEFVVELVKMLLFLTSFWALMNIGILYFYLVKDIFILASQTSFTDEQGMVQI